METSTPNQNNKSKPLNHLTPFTMSFFSKLSSLFKKSATPPHVEPQRPSAAVEPQPTAEEAKTIKPAASAEVIESAETVKAVETVELSPLEPATPPEQEKPIEAPTLSTEPTTPEVKEKAPRTRRKPSPRPKYEISLIEAFRLKYPDWIFILDFYRAANLCEPTWENLTKVRLQKFIDYMAERLAPNSVHQYATRLKVVLNIHADEVMLPKGYAKVLSPKKVISTAIYLSEDELKQLQDYAPKNDNEMYVRNMFLSSAYCGARHVDIVGLNESNIQGDKLVFVAQKTKKQAMIPLKPIVAEYIRTTPRIEMSDVGFNKIIRRICRNIGIVERVKIFKAGKEIELDKCDAVSSHTARRSFASNLYLRGIDIYTISKLLQHSEIKLTEKYIVCGTRQLEESELAYFS